MQAMSNKSRERTVDDVHKEKSLVARGFWVATVSGEALLQIDFDPLSPRLKLGILAHTCAPSGIHLVI